MKNETDTLSTLNNTPSDRKLLSTETANFIKSGIPENTIRTYGRASRKLAEWLDGRELTDARLSEYLQKLYNEGLSPSTIAVVVAAVNWQAAFEGMPKVVGKVTTETLKTIRRLGAGRGRGQVDPLTWKQVEKVVTYAEAANTIAGLRDSAMIRLMSDCLLRISEGVAVNCGDVSNVLKVRHSKTDQERKGATLYICEDTRAVIAEYREQAGIERGALFRRIRRGDVVTGQRLTTEGARLAIKRWAEKAKIKGFISGHSMRVGSAVELVKRNVSDAELRVAGRWKDNRMPSHYASAEKAERGVMARVKDGKGARSRKQ